MFSSHIFRLLKVSVTDDPSLDSTRLRRFQKMAQDMRVDLPKNVLEFPKIDYTSLQSFVLEEKTNGSLVGDPAWEELAKRNLKSWKQHLQSSLEKLNRDFRGSKFCTLRELKARR